MPSFIAPALVATIIMLQADDLQPSNFHLSEEEKTVLGDAGYVIRDVFSGGSCSLVYNAEFFYKSGSKNFPKDVPLRLACKVMETEDVPKDFVNKFLIRELDIISRVCHPHIIQTHSILQINTKVLVFMRNAEYGNLCEYISKFGPLRERQARLWFRQLAIAVEYLHIIHIVHRDVKCENVLITANNNVKLCDFGFARFSIDNKGKEVFSNTFCGSVAYAPPELIKGIPYDPKLADIWSLGIVLYVMINGIMPFRTENIQKLWVSQNNKDYRFRTSIIPKVTTEVITLVAEMLEPNWFERISIREVLHHDWIGIDPKLLELTKMESEAREKAVELGKTIRPKPMKKILDSNKVKSQLAVISQEVEPMESFKEVEKPDENPSGQSIKSDKSKTSE